jgi:hypothetical protein
LPLVVIALQIIYALLQSPELLAQVLQILGSFITKRFLEEITPLLKGECPDLADDCTAGE